MGTAFWHNQFLHKPLMTQPILYRVKSSHYAYRSQRHDCVWSSIAPQYLPVWQISWIIFFSFDFILPVCASWQCGTLPLWGAGYPDFHRGKLHLPILNFTSVCFKTKDIFLFFFFFWWTYVNHFFWSTVSTVSWGQGLYINCLCNPTRVKASANQIFNQYIFCVSILCLMRSLIYSIRVKHN